jgi:hypothetical protein
VSLPRTAEYILHLKHYGGRTALDAFQPLIGLVYTGRSLVDNLLFGVFGLTGVQVWLPLVPVVLLGLAAAATWWWRRAPRPRLLLLGLGLIGSGYLLVYSARADWAYEGGMNRPGWSRYHLLPQLGLTLFIVGGLPGIGYRVSGFGFRVRPDPSGTVSASRNPIPDTRYPIPDSERALLILLGACLVVQLPRAIACGPDWLPGQRAALEKVERVDAACRQHRISAELAAKALPRLAIPGAGDEGTGWELLRGSDDPLTLTPEEARRLLGEAAGQE